jgi:transglutaminase-like putative cysteine protease
MRQDFDVFFHVLGETLTYYFNIDLMGWWTSLTEKGTEKLYLTGILFSLLLILLWGFFHWSGRILSYCLIGGFLGILLFGGQTPSMGTMVICVLYVTVTMAAGTGKKLKTAGSGALLTLAVSLAFLIVSVAAGVPLLKMVFGDVLPLRTQIQQTSLVHVINSLLPDELKFQDGTGEYEGGSLLTKEEGPEFTGRTVVSVEIDKIPEKSIYWPRYWGNIYTGYSFNDQGNLDNPKNSANRKYPAKVLSRLEAFCRENPKESPVEIRDFIVQTLAENTEYDLKAGALPEGKDFIEYFFFENKKGYCIHYAAAATMMFRMYGIPARYVTGFLIPPSMFYLNEEGVYQADVPDDYAHAWTEVYLDGEWITIEVTPPVGIPGEYVQEEAKEETAETGETETTEAGMESQTETDGKGMTEGMAETGDTAPGTESFQPETGEGGTGTPAAPELVPEEMAPSWIFLPVILILALLLILLGLFIRRLLILDRRKKENVQELFADFYQVLVQGGLSPELGLLSENLEQEMLVLFPWLENQGVGKVLEMVIRTTYGPIPASREERLDMQRLYYFTCRQMVKNLKGMSRFVFYMIDVWI